jgi:hypothetical protein
MAEHEPDRIQEKAYMINGKTNQGKANLTPPLPVRERREDRQIEDEWQWWLLKPLYSRRIRAYRLGEDLIIGAVGRNRAFYTILTVTSDSIAKYCRKIRANREQQRGVGNILFQFESKYQFEKIEFHRNAHGFLRRSGIELFGPDYHNFFKE